MKDPNEPCLFCNAKKTGYTHDNNLAYASYDSYPVSEYHCLIIPKRHTIDFFDLSNDCLLYTSPSPRDGIGSRMPSSA